MKRILISLLFIIYCPVFAQTVTFDEFLDMSREKLKAEKLGEIREYLPASFSITALDFGDFTGDGINDFAMAVSPKGNRDKRIYTYLFVDSLGSYLPVLRDTMHYFELPIEIGFSIVNNACYVTHKINDRSWTITGFTFDRNEYARLDLYKTDTYPLTKKQLIGRENYNNYKDLTATAGYFDLNTLKDFKKSRFFMHPVYSLKRNIYKSYPRRIPLDTKWLWEDSSASYSEYGYVQISREGGDLLMDFAISRYVMDRLSTKQSSRISIYFDRSTERLSSGGNRRSPVFRSGLNDDTGSITAAFTPSVPMTIVPESNFEGNFSSAFAGQVKAETLPGGNTIRVALPWKLLNLPDSQTSAGLFISVELAFDDATRITLNNSNGSADDPSTYGRLLLIDDGDYYGDVKNEKFGRLFEELFRSGITRREQ